MLALLCIWELMYFTKITIVISKPSIIKQYFLNHALHELCLHKDYWTHPDRHHSEHNPYLGQILKRKTTITSQSPLSADYILIAVFCVGYIGQSGIGQFTDLCAYNKNEPGKKSQKPSFKVDFSLVTVATHV